MIFTSKHPARVSRIVFEYSCERQTFGCSGKISLIKYKTAYGSREIYLCENNFDWQCRHLRQEDVNSCLFNMTWSRDLRWGWRRRLMVRPRVDQVVRAIILQPQAAMWFEDVIVTPLAIWALIADATDIHWHLTIRVKRRPLIPSKHGHWTISNSQQAVFVTICLSDVKAVPLSNT